MTLPLSLPSIGNTNWGTAVNNNWTFLNNAFTSSAAFTGTTNASSSTVGAVIVGNGSAATSVGIGAGNINVGGSLAVGSSIVNTGGLIYVSTNAGSAASAAILTANSSSSLFIDPSGNPYAALVCASGGSDSKVYDCFATSASINFRFLNDAYTADTVWLQAIRSGYALNQLFIGGTSKPGTSYKGAVLWGNQDGSTSALAGQIGEVIFSNNSTLTNCVVSGSYTSITSLTLTSGYWMVSGAIQFDINGATTTGTTMTYCISSTSTGSAGILGLGSDQFNVGIIQNWMSYLITPVLYVITTTTTVFLNFGLTYTAGPPKLCGNLHAVRIR